MVFTVLLVNLFIAFTSPPMLASNGRPPQQMDDPNYVGTASCGGCHADELQQWRGSHHDLAMQAATATSVLGDFNNASFNHNGVVTRFFKKDDEFWVNTDGSDGSMADFKVAYVFGVDPIQQYLIPFADGRMQTLSITWDSRSKEQGGQRWFHMFPDTPDHEDVLHWTHQAQNWNGRCAECHSTNLQKNYDQASNSYQTSWFEIDVALSLIHI